eukprot:763522-Hanusia_phi.AAC.3
MDKTFGQQTEQFIPHHKWVRSDSLSSRSSVIHISISQHPPSDPLPFFCTHTTLVLLPYS